MDAAKKIAEALLYEGYILWPYRRSARKNRQRWTFGGIYPRAYSEATGDDDPWLMQTECLLTGNENTEVTVRVRFLHVTERRVAKKVGEGLEFVEELRVGGELYLPWEEATEREVETGPHALSELEEPGRIEVGVPGGSAAEELRGSGGEAEGALVRSWHPLRGSVEVGTEPLREGVYRLTVRITNTTPWDDPVPRGGYDTRPHGQTFVSTHTALQVGGGEFVSLTDPPEELREEAAACENAKTWPVLVGEEGRRDMMLSSPIILPDYPEIAPESPGDLFDGTEIDGLLIMNVLSLSEEEKEEMRATDPKAREILARCESLSAEELLGLHGAIREFRMLGE